MSHLLALNTEIQQLLPGMSLKSTQHNRALICDEFVKKKKLTFMLNDALDETQKSSHTLTFSWLQC